MQRLLLEQAGAAAGAAAGAMPTPDSALHGAAAKFALVLALSFLVGFEREEHKQAKTTWTFGGVRAYPLIGLSSFALALIGGENLLPWSLGYAIVGGFMLLSYQHKLSASEQVSATTEMSALSTYLVAGLVVHDQYWIAAAITVVSVLLLELKDALEGLNAKVEPGEIITVAQFLLLTVVILPIVPNVDFTRFSINPFRTWLIVVAVSGVSFGSYLIQRLLKGRGSILLSAVLGGAYSSTVTTVVLARQARAAGRTNLFAGSILAASGVMYVRLLALIAFFNPQLALVLAPGFGGAALAGIAGGWAISRKSVPAGAGQEGEGSRRNPLELKAAFVFAAAFVGILVVTSLAKQYLGRAGLYSLAALMGVTDVDPFILGLTQAHGGSIALRTAAAAIVIAASSNNVVKAFYARSFADAATGRRAFALLVSLAAVGALSLIWI